MEFYKNVEVIESPNDILVLVNKNNILPSYYVPDNLHLLERDIAYDDKYLVEDAAYAFKSLSKDASVIGYKILAVSGYRSYEYQNNLYNDYKKQKGLEYADNCCARPGHSEHQTGLAVDVMGSNNDYNLFEEAIEFDWMKNNAHKYGFILRYPKGKEKITGFKYEPWHYRYVGNKTAAYIYENNLTFEEYKKKTKN